MIIYTQTVCPKCMVAKMQLDNAGVEYEVVNLDSREDVREELKSKGFMGTPIVLYEGNFYPTSGAISELVASLQ